MNITFTIPDECPVCSIRITEETLTFAWLNYERSRMKRYTCPECHNEVALITTIKKVSEATGRHA